MVFQKYKRKKALESFLLAIPKTKYEKYLESYWVLKGIGFDNDVRIYIDFFDSLFFGCEVIIKKKALNSEDEVILESFCYWNNKIRNYILKHKPYSNNLNKKEPLNEFFDYVDVYNTDFYDQNKPYI